MHDLTSPVSSRLGFPYSKPSSCSNVFLGLKADTLLTVRVIDELIRIELLSHTALTLLSGRVAVGLGQRTDKVYPLLRHRHDVLPRSKPAVHHDLPGLASQILFDLCHRPDQLPVIAATLTNSHPNNPSVSS